MTTPSQGLVCRKCGKVVKEFAKNQTVCKPCYCIYYNGYRDKCRDKFNLYHREWRKSHKEEVKAQSKVRWQKKINSMPPEELKKFRAIGAAKRRKELADLKNEVFEAYGGWKCACCGETERSFLTMDHMDNNGGQMVRDGLYQRAGKPFYRWLQKNKFPPRFQVLCMNCQFGKRMNKGICPHQTRCDGHPEGE